MTVELQCVASDTHPHKIRFPNTLQDILHQDSVRLTNIESGQIGLMAQGDGDQLAMNRDSMAQHLFIRDQSSSLSSPSPSESLSSQSTNAVLRLAFMRICRAVSNLNSLLSQEHASGAFLQGASRVHFSISDTIDVTSGNRISNDNEGNESTVLSRMEVLLNVTSTSQSQEISGDSAFALISLELLSHPTSNGTTSSKSNATPPALQNWFEDGDIDNDDVANDDNEPQSKRVRISEHVEEELCLLQDSALQLPLSSVIFSINQTFFQNREDSEDSGLRKLFFYIADILASELGRANRR